MIFKFYPCILSRCWLPLIQQFFFVVVATYTIFFFWQLTIKCRTQQWKFATFQILNRCSSIFIKNFYSLQLVCASEVCAISCRKFFRALLLIIIIIIITILVSTIVKINNKIIIIIITVLYLLKKNTVRLYIMFSVNDKTDSLVSDVLAVFREIFHPKPKFWNFFFLLPTCTALIF